MDGIVRDNQNIFDIATLGPTGTDSENAARIIQKQKDIQGQIILCPSFIEAIGYGIEHNSYIIIPAAYLARDDDGKIVETWADLHFRNMHQLNLEDAIVLPLQEMCLAKRKDCNKPQSIALHPATEAFAQGYVPELRRVYVKSKPLGVKMCSEGETDLCIASSVVVKNFPNLELLRTWQPDMVWTLYSKR